MAASRSWSAGARESASPGRPSANERALRPASAGAQARRTLPSACSAASRAPGVPASPTACSRNGPGTAVTAPPAVGGAVLPVLRSSISASGEPGPAARLRMLAAMAGAPGPSHRPSPRAGTGKGGSRWIPASRSASDSPQVSAAGGGTAASASRSADACPGPCGEARARCTTGVPRSASGNGGAGGACSTEMLVARDGPIRGRAAAQAETTASRCAAGHSRYPAHRSSTAARPNSSRAARPAPPPPRNAHSASRSAGSAASSAARRMVPRPST